LAQDAVQKEFTPEVLAGYGLPEEALNFDFGQEDENQESFMSLLVAFPILLFAMYLLLAAQFRSLLQPLLIFMAIPFSFFGITLALYWSDNAFSFFAMLGFFALIGLSIKNTILLVDYANQLRRAGKGVIDSVVGALSERFRPLIATSLTAVVSLIPLSLISPFWEGLALLLIGGMLSSTLLVVTVFPYYYLGAEYLRLKVSRKAGLTWLVLATAAAYGVIATGLTPVLIPLAILAVTLAQIYAAKRLRKA
jgi:multidrug efflux pump subunit AcrB